MAKLVTIVGSYNVGIFLKSSKFPKPGETILADNYFEGPGGKGSNQALPAKKLGANTNFIGKLGNKKVFGKTVNFAGGPAINIREADVPEKIRKDMMTGKVGKDFQAFMSKNTQFAPSVPQTLGQIAGSYGAIMTVEPMFYPNRPDASNTAASQGDVTVQQLMQRHVYSQILTNPAAARRVLTNEDSQISGSEGGGNPIYNSNLAPGTLYQMAGNPMRGM